MKEKTTPHRTATALKRRGRKRRTVSLYLAAVLATALVGFAGGLWGGKISPLLRQAFSPEPKPMALENGLEVEAWIAPPDYIAASTVALATSSGIVSQSGAFTAPEGSILHMHVHAEGDAPTLDFGGQTLPLDAEGNGDFVATRRIGREEMQGDFTVRLHQGWREIASWRLTLMADEPPHVSIRDAQTPEGKSQTILSYDAEDDYGIKELFVRVTPLFPAPDQVKEPIDVPLSIARGKRLRETVLEDLAWLPWAGQVADVQLVAEDGAGNKTVSEKKKITLPTRSFKNPVARALVEERKKLLTQKNEATRVEVVNVMAGIAQQPASYGGDPLVMMALRTGAVRLVFNRGENTIEASAGLMWRAAVRIEEASSEQQRAVQLLRHDKAKKPANEGAK